MLIDVPNSVLHIHRQHTAPYLIFPMSDLLSSLSSLIADGLDNGVGEHVVTALASLPHSDLDERVIGLEVVVADLKVTVIGKQLNNRDKRCHLDTQHTPPPPPQGLNACAYTGRDEYMLHLSLAGSKKYR